MKYAKKKVETHCVQKKQLNLLIHSDQIK